MFSREIISDAALTLRLTRGVYREILFMGFRHNFIDPNFDDKQSLGGGGPNMSLGFFSNGDRASWTQAMKGRPAANTTPLFAVLQSDPLIPLALGKPTSFTPPPPMSPPKLLPSASSSPPPPPSLMGRVSAPIAPPEGDSNAHPPLSLHQESAAIKKSLEDAVRARGGLAMDYSCEPCSPTTLLTTLTGNPNLTIFHYSGHGTDTFLTLEGDDGR